MPNKSEACHWHQPETVRWTMQWHLNQTDSRLKSQHRRLVSRWRVSESFVTIFDAKEKNATANCKWTSADRGNRDSEPIYMNASNGFVRRTSFIIVYLTYSSSQYMKGSRYIIYIPSNTAGSLSNWNYFCWYGCRCFVHSQKKIKNVHVIHNYAMV